MATEKPVTTIAGAFDRKRLAALKVVLDGEDRDAFVMFEGNHLLVGFGQYLVEYVEGVFAGRNHAGL